MSIMETNTEKLVPSPADKSPMADRATMKVAKRLSEGGHWYTRTGEQIDSVPSADGKKMVKPTIVHARKYDLAPGITTIMREASSWGLVEWMCQQYAFAARDLPPTVNEAEGEWYSRVRDLATKKSEDAKNLGTAIHAAVQAHMQEGGPYDPQFKPHIDAVLRVLPQDSETPWQSELAVVNLGNGYGTKIDLCNDRWVINLKGKDGSQEDLDNLKLYDEHFMQTAAERQALISMEAAKGEEAARKAGTLRCGILFVSRTHPGAASLHAIKDEDSWRGWAMFESLTTFWQRKNRHRPWAKQENF